MKIFKLFSILIVLLLINNLFSTNLRITQIDNSDLLFNQRIKVYVSVTDHQGEPIKGLDARYFQIAESSDLLNFTTITDKITVDSADRKPDPITFLLLLDNSGSMYYNEAGYPTQNKADMRITRAKKALSNFLQTLNTERDQIGLAVYHSNYTLFQEPVNDPQLIEEKLEQITKPQGDEGWTEIYASLSEATADFQTLKGRKVIILLSDGKNLPFYQQTGKIHPVYGDKIFEYTEPINQCQTEGISVFSVFYGSKLNQPDIHLDEIASQTGGTTFKASTSMELSKIYEKISRQIKNEYLITYPATMLPGEYKWTSIKMIKQGKTWTHTRSYFNSNLFGHPITQFSIWYLFLIPLALFLFVILSFIKFKNRQYKPTLEFLTPGNSTTRMITLNKKETLIGDKQNADITLLNSDFNNLGATVKYNESTQTFQIQGDKHLTVNNKKVKTKVLEPGDLLTIGDTKLIFDHQKKAI
ncbi:MAG: VWA domain-containing protein [Spirochaetes bacterium]|nr:VWA domain-containing protein [Spirochaetota bacterium]